MPDSMPDHAIVIGIDRYDHSPWNLSAAVRDACAFADWVTKGGAGRATRQTLTLLLSPLDGKKPKLPPDGPATRDAVHAAFARYARKEEVEADRLWVYYAGHGITGDGDGLDGAPVLVPSDAEEDLGDYQFNAPIGLAKYVKSLRVRTPRTQLFFIDCCRGVADPTSAVTTSTQLHFDMKKMGPNPRGAMQAVLYATTAGSKANEVGLHGLFGQAVLEGLAGSAPLVPDAVNNQLVLTISGLAQYVKRRVEELALDAKAQERQVSFQIPDSPALMGTTGDLPLVKHLPPGPVATLGLMVEPVPAAQVATAGLNRWDPMTMQYVVEGQQSRSSRGFSWKLPLGTHILVVDADGYDRWTKPVDLHRDRQELALLVENAGALDGLEAISSPPPAIDVTPGSLGGLLVEFPDRFTRIEVFDAGGQRVEAGWSRVELSSLAVGPYRVEIALPGERPVVRNVLVTAGGREVIAADVRPARPTSPLLEEAVRQLGMRPHDGLAEPSEAFGPTTTNRVGSVLAWAAWAARSSANWWGHKLRSVGVAIPAGARLLVLIGDAAPGVTFLADLVVFAGSTGQEGRVAPSAVPGLAGSAVQWATADERIVSVVVAGPSMGNVAVPVASLAGFVDVVVIARESDGAVEIHRYLMPHAADGAPWAIRWAELGWRALAARTPLLPGEAEQTVAQVADPLALAVLGYRLAREGKPFDQVVGLLVARSPDLPDTHVLAALVDPERRDAHLQRAAAVGMPRVAEGARILSEWLTEGARQNDAPPPVTLRPWLDAQPWTLFDAQRKPSQGHGVLATAALARGSRPWADGVLAVAASTARIENPALGYPYSGPGFMVGRRLLLTSRPVIHDHEDGWIARFGRQLVTLSILRRVEREPGMGVVLLSADRGRRPARLSWHLPRVGQRIAVIAYPASDVRLPPSMAATLAATVRLGEQALVLGMVRSVEADGSSFDYDAWTLAGAAGGPVVDLESGAVIGVHHSGRLLEEEEVKIGIGVPLAFLRDRLDLG